MEPNRNPYTVRERDDLQPATHGDAEALGSVLASYMPQLHRVALRVLGTPEEAEDALQDGLVQVVKHFREFEGRSRLSTWLTRIVINAALMRLRRRRREATTSMDQTLGRDDDLSLAENIRDSRPNPEQAYASEEGLHILRQKLRSLPGAYGSTLWLRDIQGLSTREAAETLGIPVGSVKSNLHRARLSLRAEAGAARDTHKIRRTSRSDATRSRRRASVDLMEDLAKQAA